MATYIVLMNLTDQGIRNVKQIPERRKAGAAAAEKLGIKVKEAYSTLGAMMLLPSSMHLTKKRLQPGP